MRQNFSVLGPVVALAVSLPAQNDAERANHPPTAEPAFVASNTWLAKPVMQRDQEGELQELGKVGAIVVHLETGRIDCLAVHLGPVDGEDVGIVEIPMGKMELDAEQAAFVCRLTPGQLHELRPFDPDRYRLGEPKDHKGVAESSSGGKKPRTHLLLRQVGSREVYGRGDAPLGRIARFALETTTGVVAFAELEGSRGGERHLVPWSAMRIDLEADTPRVHIDIAGEELTAAPVPGSEVLKDREKRKAVYEHFRVSLPEYERRTVGDGAGR